MISFSFQTQSDRNRAYFVLVDFCQPLLVDPFGLDEARLYPFMVQVQPPDEAIAAKIVFDCLTKLNKDLKFKIYQNTGSTLLFGQHSISSETPIEVDWSGSYRQAIAYGNSSPSIGDAVEPHLGSTNTTTTLTFDTEKYESPLTIKMPPRESLFAITLPPRAEASALRNKLTELFELGFECGKDFDRFNTDSLEQKRDRLINNVLSEFHAQSDHTLPPEH